jgi:quercetin dioxygenase-like cupin family protein
MRLVLALTTTFVMAGAVLPAIAQAPTHAGAHQHQQYTPQDIKWTPAPASFPRGAEAALLYGDPAREGPFVLRLRFPAGYRIAPHRHTGAEILTVISGTFVYGAGEVADASKAQPLPAGSFTAMPAGMPHFAHADGVTVVQLNSMGPWSITYVNPNDDPRRQPQ